MDKKEILKQKIIEKKVGCLCENRNTCTGENCRCAYHLKSYEEYLETLASKENNTKLIFLDIDGVLNCQTTAERWGGYIGIDPEKVEILNRIVKETGAGIVLSSTWRQDPDWRVTMHQNGLPPMIDRTPSLGGERGEEVEDWLCNYLKNENEVQSYAILDDDSDFFPTQPHFKTTWEDGLTPRIAQQIIDHLNGNPQL